MALTAACNLVVTRFEAGLDLVHRGVVPADLDFGDSGARDERFRPQSSMINRQVRGHDLLRFSVSTLFSRRLASIPGVGMIGAMAIACTLPEPAMLRCAE
jgi:hypothetical protein